MAYKSFIGNSSLNTYEEGSFDPVVQGSGTAGTPTYTSRNGVYRKIGDWVFINIFINLSNLTGATGTLQVVDLPYTALNLSGFNQCFVFRTGNLVYDTGDTMFQAYVSPNTTEISLYSVEDGNAEVGIAIDTAWFATITGGYLIEPT